MEDTNLFRPKYRELSEFEKKGLDDIKQQAQNLADAIQERCPLSREQSLAMTKLEESVMWAVKGLTG